MTRTHAARPATRRALAALACLAATAMLAGCGDDSDRADASSSLTDAPSSGATSDPTADPTAGPTAGPTEDAAPASPTTTDQPSSPGSGTSGPPSQEATAPTTPAPTRASEPVLIPYAGGESPGVQVRSAADTSRLKGAPEAFKEFIGRAAEHVVAKSHCVDGFVGLTVEAVRTDGYAIGGVNDCGGYLALWAVVDGQWTEVAGTQEEWDCAVLRRAAAPSELVGEKCYDYDAEQERDYHQA